MITKKKGVYPACFQEEYLIRYVNRIGTGSGNGLAYGFRKSSCQNQMVFCSITLLLELGALVPSCPRVPLLSVTVRLTQPEVKMQQIRRVQ
jgi:hypothetical protein